MRKILETLNSFGSIPKISLDKFINICSAKAYEKGSMLTAPPQVCNRLYFVEEGLIRSYFFKESKEITISFTSSGEFVTAMGSYIQGSPTYEHIEALTPLKVQEIKREELESMLASDLFLASLYRSLLEQYYVKIEEKLVFGKFKTAKERYEEFMRTKPHILQQASIGHIASYLDMSLETLSRIRAKW
jgi:CRP-like cAMP-binding protein